MAIIDRLPTRDRLARMSIGMDRGCVLCGLDEKSRNHIFGDCPYACRVWDVVLQACRLPCRLRGWEDNLTWLICNLRGNFLIVCILKIAWTNFLYFIWEERNFIIFRGVERSLEVVYGKIKDIVCSRLFGYFFKQDGVNLQLCEDWGC
ncbi:uncharacterized protein LOC120144379 [Hibiscus syriacus]|uniref:uncharacterized protein LOC120144379 n=1 Tax=Hibiscus syriacus TaxID=106335 RepID=UPI001921058F|nr:uncharacterized protein LOC120144379 [Hibiscus syriacus]